MCKRVIFWVTFVTTILFLFASSAFADNKVGSFKEEFQGTHYYGYLPYDCDKAKNVPLVVVFHGNGSAENFIAGWINESEKYKFAVLAIKSKGVTWTSNDDELVMDAIVDFRNHINFNKNRILWVGFSGGAQFALRMCTKSKICNALGLVCGGVKTEYIHSSDLEKSKDLPIYYMSGTKDPNLAEVTRTKEKLDNYGYNVKMDVYPDMGHDYPADASEKYWKWFDNIGTMHRIDRISEKAKKAFDEKKIFEAYDLYFKMKLLCMSVSGDELKENKKKVEEYKTLIKEKLGILEDKWKEIEPDAFKAIDKCFKCIEKDKFYDAVKNFKKLIEKFAESEAAKLAKTKIVEILEAHMDVADKVAGAKPKSALKKAEKTLDKSSRTEDEKKEAIAELEKIIVEFPYTSYAKRAKELIALYK